MDTKTNVDDGKLPMAVSVSSNTQSPYVEGSTEVVADIYIDPLREKAALRKFDKWLVPVAFSFLVLSSLDRNTVSLVLKPTVALSLTSKAR